MRIRKHANISLSDSLHTLVTVHPHVCQLNRSPWDAITFPLESNGRLYPDHYQREDVEEDEGTDGLIRMGNGISVTSVVDGSVEKEFLEEEGKRREEKVNKRNRRRVGNRKETIRGKRNKYSSKGKGRQVNKKEDEGHSVGDRGCGRKKRGRALSSNSEYYCYYYYSGFGPLWGSKRGESERMDGITPLPLPLMPSSSSSSSHDFYDDGHDEKLTFKKKKTRKRVKARSLKSLL